MSKRHILTPNHVTYEPSNVKIPLRIVLTHMGRRFCLTDLNQSVDVVIRSTFGIDSYGSFGSVEVQSLPSLIELTTGPYLTAALPGLQVMSLVYVFMEFFQF